MTTKRSRPAATPALEPAAGLPPEALGLYQAGCLLLLLGYLLLFTPWL